MTNLASHPIRHVCVGLLLFGAIELDQFAIAQSPPVSRIVELMGAHPDQLAQGMPIRVHGTVSLVADGITSHRRRKTAAHSFCLEDESAGIWVRSGHALREGVVEGGDRDLAGLKYGDEIELEGFLEQGAFAPVIMPTRIKILGQSELPEAPRAVTTRFLNGADEIRRVTVNGVVQDVSMKSPDWLSLRVETGVGHFVTRVPREQQYSASRLLDAEVELTGVAVVCWNWRSEFVCPRLIINRRDDIRILQPASDPFDVEMVSLKKLDSYSPNGRPRHRRRTQGTVTYYDQDLLLYIQEDGVGIQVRLNQPVSVEIGDHVQVSGFIDQSRYLAGLRGALVRRSGRRELAVTTPTTITQIIENHRGFRQGQPTTTESCDGQLITLRGRLLDFQGGLGPNPHRLEIDCGDAVTTAFLSEPEIELSPGTEVEVTGIAKLGFSVSVASANLARPDRVDLLLRDANDIVVLRSPSWWTLQRTFNALLVVAAFGLAAFLWASTLRRTLTQRTDQLAEEMRNRRDAALEFQGAIRERTRLAANLHDTLLQNMAGIAYQLEACRDPETRSFTDHLDTASRMIQHGQDDLRNTVWTLHCLPLAEGTFADSVRQVTRKIGSAHDTPISVRCDDRFPTLADFIAGNLLLVIQESCHNAIKHASAESIQVDLRVSSSRDRISVLVRDNGIGFDVTKRKKSRDGHFGIEGMEQRIERLGGELFIDSQISVGTTIRVDVPLRGFDPKIA